MLYEAASPHLYALLLRILHNEERAQDALQDTFIEVWRKAETYLPERGPPARSCGQRPLPVGVAKTSRLRFSFVGAPIRMIVQMRL